MSRTRIEEIHDLGVSVNVTNPTQLSDMLFWIDGFDPNAIGTPPVAGTAIPTISDKSGNGYTFTSTGVSGTYEASTINGQSGIQITNTQHGYRVDSSLSEPASDMTVFYVGQMNVPGGGPNCYMIDMFAGSRMLLNATSGSGCGWYYDGAARLPAVGFDRVPVLATWRREGTNGAFRSNGVEIRSVTNLTSIGWNSTFTLGGRYTGDAVSNFDGFFGELLVYNRALPENEMVGAESYLRNKWGF